MATLIRNLLVGMVFGGAVNVLGWLLPPANAVSVVAADRAPAYVNFPRISQVFRGDSDRQRIEQTCLAWVEETRAKIPADRIFEASCLYEKDVPLREHVYTGWVTLKVW